MRHVFSTAVIVLVAAAAFAQAPDDPKNAKRAWQWSDEERIAARLDPAYIAKHVKPSSTAPGKVTYVISGLENPQLFLPYELFNWLMGGLSADPAFRDTTRSMLRERIKKFGYDDPSTFWKDLETVTRTHAEALRRNGALHKQLQTASRAERDAIANEIERQKILLCRSRADALAAARSRFGRETFDRFLYTVVAAQLTVDSSPPSADEARGLAYVEGGCR